MSPLSVLHLVLSFRPGGRKNAILNLASHFDSSIQSHLCCLEELGCEPQEVQLFQSVTVLEKRRRGLLRAVRDLLTLCSSKRIQLIHAHDAASQFLGSLVRIFQPRVKLIMTFHRSLGFESEKLQDRMRNKFCSLLTKKIVTASQDRRRHYISENRVPTSKLIVIPFGMDPKKFYRDLAIRNEIRTEYGLTEKSILIGTIGHYGEEKGVDQAIQGFNRLIQLHPELDARLLVFGKGTEEQRDKIERLANENSHHRVQLLGYQPNIYRWYSALDILLHSPRLEAFGLVLIEAMGCQLPIVATRVGSIPEIVRQNETGLVVDAGSIEAIAEGLFHLISNPEFREKLSRNAGEVAGLEYTNQLCAIRYADLYREVCYGKSLNPGSSSYQ